jgi:hypothetical protein
VNEELCELPAVRLVRWQREDHLNRADQGAIRKRTEQQPAAALDLVRHGFECFACLLV